jgi:hypothetical protein
MKNDSGYIELLKRALTNYLYLGDENPWDAYCWTHFHSEYSSWSIPQVCRPHTCLRKAQLDNLHDCILTVLDENIPGDFIEAGVYKGGAVIFMRGLLRSLNIEDRTVWVADSFSGIPITGKNREIDDYVDQWEERFEASFDEVQSNFRRYDLLDSRVKFLKGYFADTLPAADFEALAIARLDGDSYDSTMDALTALYPRLSSGGYIIVDDWHLPSCRQAVFDYRQAHDITCPIFYKSTEIGPTSLDGSPEAEGSFEAYWRVD